MDPIRSITIAPLPVVLPGRSAAADSAPVLPKPASPAPAPEQASFDVEQARYEAVTQAAQDIANQFVLGDQRFTIYKDMTGQYITRFTNVRDGKVTYIPEPSLMNMRRSPQPSVTLNV